MASFVKIILEASFTAGLAALAVMLIRLAMKKAPKRWAYALWAVVFFRCLCPFSVESGLSVFNAVNAIPERTAETETVEALSEAAENSEIENILPVQIELDTYGHLIAASSKPVYVPPAAVRTETVPEKKPVNKYAVMFGVWAFGASAMALYGVISYVLLMRKLRTAVKTEAGVYESDLISTAFSAGFFPPKIYVPCGLFEEERKLIIAHERVHIKRLDYIIKPVAFLGLAVHWFNPVIWLAFALMTKDMELSCDEAVLKIFGAGEKKAYSEALLRVSMKRSGLADNYKFMPLAFAETGIKGRVKNVLKYKKPTVIVTVLAAAVVVSACAVLGTNAKSKAEDTDESMRYIPLLNDVNNFVSDSDGERIMLFKDFNSNSDDGKKRFSEGISDEKSASFSVDLSENDLIMDADMTELKINSLDVVQEDGKNILKAQFEFKAADDFVLRGNPISFSDEERLRLLTTEGGGNDGVYIISAEYELAEDGSNGYSFMLHGFDDIPVYINSELVKNRETEYVPVPEGETEYTLADGEKVCIANDPNKTVSVDGMQNIKFYANAEEDNTPSSVLIGMRAKNDMLDRQCGVDFTGEEIAGLAVDEISVSQSSFTVRFKITYANGSGGAYFDENEPNSSLRLVKGESENEAYLYMTALYGKENVKEYAIDINGFDNITPQINAACVKNRLPEGEVVYEQIFKGTTNLSLDGYVPAYIACGLDVVGSTGVIGYSDTVDGGQSMLTGFHDDYSFQFHNAYTNEIDTVRIANYGENDYIHILGMTTKFGANTFATSLIDMEEYGVKSLTLEDMYTEIDGDYLDLNIDLKFTSDTIDVMDISGNQFSASPGTYGFSIHKLANEGEYMASYKIRYLYGADSLDSFAIILSGFDEAEKYVNPRLVLNRGGFYTQEETSPYDNAEIEKVYKSNDLVMIKLYNNGLFKVTDYLSSYMPVIISEKRYRFENGSLILEFNDGSVLCFDETYGTGTQVGGEASFAFNKAASHKTDARSRDVPFYNDGKVFAPDNEWLEIEKAAEREKAYQSSVNYSDLEMVYSREYRSIYLYKNGDFDLYDSSWENDPNEGIDGSYKIDGETLTLKHKNGSKLCFDMVSSGKDETDPDLVKEFEMCKYKLVYNKNNSRIPKKSAEDIPEIYHGEVFDFDGGFIETKMQAGEVSEEFIKNRTLTDEEIRQMEEEQERVKEEIRSKLEEEQKRAEEALKSSYPALQYPVSAPISEGYSAGDNFHHGIDFAVSKGTEVYAAADGTVTEIGTGFNGGYGNSVTISHVGTMETVYAHLDEVLVKEGDEVNAGDLIGYSGSTGDAVGAELHFEVRIDGQFVDPMDYLQ